MTDKQIDNLCEAIRRIAYGTVTGPTGLEALSMAFSRDGGPTVADALSRIAEAISEHAQAIDGLAASVERAGIKAL